MNTTSPPHDNDNSQNIFKQNEPDINKHKEKLMSVVQGLERKNRELEHIVQKLVKEK